MAIFEPQGVIALAERDLIITATFLMLLVVIPVFTLVFFFAWRYRAGNPNKGVAYMPEWEHAKMDELIWWAIPFEIVLILGAFTWSSTHALDPHKPIESQAPALTIEVVALQWKWLFIYPEQDIATVNYVQFPVDRPVRFQITADAPMNSFWIPQLGGQIYAMTGMVTTLNLMATAQGTFPGISANYSGAGFADMKFEARATSDEEFREWVRATKQSSQTLSLDTYTELSKPSIASNVATYGAIEKNLFDTIVMKFNSAAEAHIHH